MDKKNTKEPREMDEYAQDLRHLIVMDTQYGWNGETTLKLPEIEQLVARGWVAEGDENNEYDITDAGRAAIDAALISAAPAPKCVWPDCGHDTNCVGYNPGCTGQFCPKSAAPAGFVVVPREPTEVWAAAVTKALSLHNAGYGSAVIREVLAAAPAAVVAHSDDIAVDKFASAMKEKLAAARSKGRGGWDDREDLEQHLSNLLRAHVDKGDPRDVANFCCFLWNRGESICAAPAVLVDESEDALVMRLDELLAAQGRLMFARDRYDEDQATNFGVSLLDFMRLHGTELRRRAALTAALGREVGGG